MFYTFFGHRDCPHKVVPALKATIENLIVNKGADTFLVGHQGQFDAHVYFVLRELREAYQHIRLSVVLAYLPQKPLIVDAFDTVLPEGRESVPRRFAISYRNKWMLCQADCVVTYVTRPFGGAAQFEQMAQKAGKYCIHLA